MQNVFIPANNNSVESSISAVASVFPDARIQWSITSANAGNQTYQITGMAPDSMNKVVITANERSATATYYGPTNQVLEQGEPRGSVGPAAAAISPLITARKVRESNQHDSFSPFTP